MKLTVGRTQLEIDLVGLVASATVLVAVIVWRQGMNEVLSSVARRLGPTPS
jgi:hypothetical protein